MNKPIILMFRYFRKKVLINVISN